MTHLVRLDADPVDVGLLERLDGLPRDPLDETQVPSALGDSLPQHGFVERNDFREPLDEVVDVDDVPGNEVDRILLAVDGQWDSVAILDDPALRRDLDPLLLLLLGVYDVAGVREDLDVDEGPRQPGPEEEEEDVQPGLAAAGDVQALRFHGRLLARER